MLSPGRCSATDFVHYKIAIDQDHTYLEHLAQELQLDSVEKISLFDYHSNQEEISIFILTSLLNIVYIDIYFKPCHYKLCMYVFSNLV